MAVTSVPVDDVVADLVAQVPLRAQVLEIGCGTGALARRLAVKRGARVTAIDSSARMIDVARASTPTSLGIDYRVADILTLSPRGFDVVMCVDTLASLPLTPALERMAAAVVPSGIVMIADRAPSWFMGSLRRDLRDVLPCISVRRHLGGRYSAMWSRT